MTKQLMPRLPAGNYIPHVPEPPQVAFLLTDRLIAKPLEVMFGGAAGGGKNSKISPSKYREIKASNIADTSTEVRPDTLAAMEKKWKEEGHREAEVLTPHGFVPLGDLRPGMQVCNPDGTVSKIRAIHLPGVQQMYRITMADGSSTVAGAEHLWTYRAARTRKRRKASAAKDYFDIPLDTLPHGVQRWAMDLQTKFTICDTVELKKRVDGGAESILLPQCRPQRLASKRGKWPHLSPYITGALLGDGSVTQRGVYFCSDDAEIVDRVAEELPPHLELRKHANQEGRPESWWQGGIVVRPEFQDSTLSRGDKNEGRGSGSVGGLRETAQRILERDGVFGKGAAEKFIPRWCKEGSLEDRWGVIQGLMDTDGYADDRGHCQFVSISERLALDVQWVCRSLGFRATLTSKIPTYQHDGETKEGQRAYLVQIAGNDLGRLFHLRRKKERCRTDWNGNNISDAHRVISVEPEDEMTAMCISVDHPNGLYVTDDFIVTHNSDALLMAALQFSDVPGYSALILRRTFNDLNEPGALMDRARKWLSKTDAKAVRGGREWDFPSGARLVFGHVQYHREAEEQFSGAEFQYIGIDELTRGWEERTYEFLLSRIRRPSETNSWRMQAAPDGTTLADVPLRMRSATNPGGSGHCFATATVLTPDRGWVDIREMKVGDSVFSLAEDGVMLETRVDQVHRHEFDGELIQVNARGLHMEFTPEHRIARVGGGRGKENWHKAFQLQTFDELPGQAVVLRSAIGGWKGISFGASPDWFELVGIYLAEGSKGNGQFTLAQKNPEGRLHISDLLDRLGISHSTASDEQIAFSRGSVDGYFDRFGVSHEKYIPDELKAASVPQLQALLNGLMFDGHWQSEDGGTYYTSSQRLAEDFSEVALKCGYIVKMSERDRRGEAAGLNGRGQEIVHRHVSYEVAIKRTKSGGTEILTGNHLYDVGTETKRRSDVERVPYRGPVYCIGVPETHNFIVKQRGSVWVSGNSWVKRRFINEETKGNRIFIPSLLQDNPHLNQEEYEHALMQLDPVTRERLLRGDWDIVEAGAVFSRDTFQFQMEIPTGKDVKWARCWDFAATDAGAKDEPDFTVGALVGMGPDGKWYLADIQRVQMDTDKVERLVYNTAMADGRRVPIVIEQEPGSAGKVVISHFTRNILQGWEVHGDRPTGSKSERARPWAAAASSGNFFICSNPDNPKGWVPDFFNEVELFPTPRIHDDQVDAVSGAFNWLAENRRGGGLVL